MLNKLCVMLVCLCFVCGCKHTTGETDSENSLVAEFKVKDKFGIESTVFVIGEEIHLELTVTNTEDFAVIYETTGPGHNFQILEDGEAIWFSGEGAYPAVVEERVLEANEVMVFKGKWNGVIGEGLNKGNIVESGEYTAFPWLWLWVLHDDGNIRVDVPDPIKITLN